MTGPSDAAGTPIAAPRYAPGSPGRVPLNLLRMQVGINYAYQDFGCDFGLPAYNGRKPWQHDIDAKLDLFQSLGISVVRMFILGAGWNYGRPRFSNGWHFDPPSALDPSFFEDLADLLDRIASRQLKLVPCLMGFEMVFDPPNNRIVDFAGPSPTGYVGGGRADIMLDPRKQRLFFDTVLDPFLTEPFRGSSRRRDAVYAWEVCNEPEWCAVDGLSFRTSPLHNHPNPPPRDRPNDLIPRRAVPLQTMKDFVAAANARIRRAGFPTTVGYANYESIARWGTSALHIDIPQFHYYGDPHELPPCPLPGTIVGEFATARHNPWPFMSDQSVRARLVMLQALGYAGAYLWSADTRANSTAASGPVEWTPATQSEVLEFTGGPDSA